MFRIALIDDEESCRNNLKSILSGNSDYSICNEACSVKSALQLLNLEYFDVLLMDIELGDGTAFDVIDHFPDIKSAIIFVTAHNEYALRAFQYSALDYILKPVIPDDLFRALEKQKKKFDLSGFTKQFEVFSENFHFAEKEPKRIVLKTSDIIYIVQTADIIRCEADKNYTMFHMNDASTILVSKSLKEYEMLLAANRFIRVHHSHLVNINHIKRFHKQHGPSLLMSDNSEVPVSGRKKEHLIAVLQRL